MRLAVFAPRLQLGLGFGVAGFRVTKTGNPRLLSFGLGSSVLVQASV